MSVLSTIGKLFIALGTIGAQTSLVLGNQGITTWSAVSIGFGLALVFLRQAFRPTVLFEDDRHGQNGT